MTREDSIRQIENYPPFNEQEEKDKALILGWISNNENAFSRENTVAHITASAWVVNKDRSKVLMVYHNIQMQMAGHIVPFFHMSVHRQRFQRKNLL